MDLIRLLSTRDSGQVYFLPTKGYELVLLALVVSAILSLALFLITYYLNPKDVDPEKLSPYECGFDPFSDARQSFDVKFYLVSILFIIFDLEVVYLFPWALTLGSIGLFGLVSMFLFLSVLTVGFFYEWYKGALDWD
jgi:NADH-quinone oxidoreductase subunit A